MTDGEMAREVYAAICNKPVECWTVVTAVEIGVWYDFYDLTTCKYGQCMMNEGGKWHQEPRGEKPVILRYDPKLLRATKGA